MEKAFVAQRVAKKLFTTEAAVDSALVEAAELMGEMLKARQDISVSLVFADDVQVKMMEAMKALSEARSAMVGVHNELNEAILVNPTDTKELADAILQGLTMPLTEQRSRLSYMKKRLKDYDVVHWVNDFLDQLQNARLEQEK